MKSAMESIHDYKSPDDFEVHLTETPYLKDPRSYSKEMKGAKEKESRDLVSKDTFKVILKQEVSKDGNVLPGKFVLTIKSKENGSIKHKAR